MPCAVKTILLLYMKTVCIETIGIHVAKCLTYLVHLHSHLLCDILSKSLEQEHSIYIITIVYTSIHILDSYCLFNNVIMINTFLYIGFIV